MAISNRYQIGDDWELSSLEPENGAKPDFRALFCDEATEIKIGAPDRESAAQQMLEKPAKPKRRIGFHSSADESE